MTWFTEWITYTLTCFSMDFNAKEKKHQESKYNFALGLCRGQWHNNNCWKQLNFYVDIYCVFCHYMLSRTSRHLIQLTCKGVLFKGWFLFPHVPIVSAQCTMNQLHVCAYRYLVLDNLNRVFIVHLSYIPTTNNSLFVASVSYPQSSFGLTTSSRTKLAKLYRHTIW